MYPLQLSWILDEESRERRYLIITLGNDGKVLVWACEEGVRVVRACRLLTESIPRSIRVSRAKGSTEVGGGSWCSTPVVVQMCHCYKNMQ